MRGFLIAVVLVGLLCGCAFVRDERVNKIVERAKFEKPEAAVTYGAVTQAEADSAMPGGGVDWEGILTLGLTVLGGGGIGAAMTRFLRGPPVKVNPLGLPDSPA